MYLAYTLALVLALVLALPYWLVQMMRAGKYRAGLASRFGRVPAILRPTTGQENCIWVHAVSVGEVLAVVGLVQRIQKKFPGWRLCVSTTTLAGQKLACERFAPENVFYFPLDLPWAVKAYIRRLRPRLIVIAETEFWPNFLHHAHAAGSRIAIVNAR